MGTAGDESKYGNDQQSDQQNSAEVADATGTPYGEIEDEVSDGQIVDLITGEAIKLDEKESARQEEERKLLEEFGYEKADFRDLIRRDVRVRPVQLKARRFPLVVLRDGDKGKDPAGRLLALIDILPAKTKPDDSAKGVDALAGFLCDTPGAEYAVWTNGTERLVYWKKTDAIATAPLLINDIPRYGRGLEDSFAPGRRKLRRAVSGSLRQAFKRCHDYIYANRGGSNEDVFWEFLKIVFAKIEDERLMLSAPPGTPDADGLFKIVSLEERNDPARAQAVKDRVDDLYNRVRTRYPELFRRQTMTIDMPPRIVVYVVSQLGHYDFLNSSVDVKGEAYEAIVGKNLQGTRGEFFTPRNGVKMGIRMLDPKPGEKCGDPAGGTGGFIVVILNYMADQIRADVKREGLSSEKAEREFTRRLRLASQNIFGLDINPNLVRVARMNMVMNNDGQGGITHLDALNRDQARWELPAGTMKRYAADGLTQVEVAVDEFFRGALQEGTFDVIATNPPFGTKIKIDSEEILGKYDLGFRWTYDTNSLRWKKTGVLQKGVPPEILFIERVVSLLKPGTGRACMVLPNGILGNPDDEYIRAWILQHCQVLALVAMPVELFLPKVGIQTHLVFLRRKSTEEMNKASIARRPMDYEIFMAIAKKVGKDRRGNTLYKRDADGTELTHFRSFEGRDLHEEWKRAGVYEFVPEVDEYGRMVDDDLPFVAQAYHEFLKRRTGHGR
jgi:type I restriction enzyme M protein